MKITTHIAARRGFFKSSKHNKNIVLPISFWLAYNPIIFDLLPASKVEHLHPRVNLQAHNSFATSRRNFVLQEERNRKGGCTCLKQEPTRPGHLVVNLMLTTRYVRRERRHFWSTHSRRVVTPVESGQPMSWGTAVPRPCQFSRSAAPAAGPHCAVSPAVSRRRISSVVVDRPMIRLRGRGRASWSEKPYWGKHAETSVSGDGTGHANQSSKSILAPVRRTHTHRQRGTRGTMKLQEAALLCAVLTVVAGKRAFAQSRNILYVDWFTFLSLLASRFQKPKFAWESRKNGRNRWNFRRKFTTFLSASL